MLPRTVGKRPVNLKLGSQRVKVGYVDHRPDGSDILIPRIPKTQFHVSLHPEMIHVSDNRGLDLRLELFSVENQRELIREYAGFVESLLKSLEPDPEFDEDLVAVPDPEARFGRLVRRSRHGIDLDVLGALRSPSLGLPVVLVEEEAALAYLETYGERALFLVGVESGRAYLVPKPSTVIGWEVNWDDIFSIARQLPFAQRFVEAFAQIGDHLKQVEESGIAPYSLIEREFERLDEEQIEREFMMAVSDIQPPFLKRFTTGGFERFDLS